MGLPSCACVPPDGDDWTKPWLRECSYHGALRTEVEQLRQLCSHAGLLKAQEEHNALRAELAQLRHLYTRAGFIKAQEDHNAPRDEAERRKPDVL